MSRTIRCPSSGENTLPIRHLVLVNLYRVTNSRCHIGKVFSPDDGHIVCPKHVEKTINILRKFVHQVGSVKKKIFLSVFLLSVLLLMCSTRQSVDNPIGPKRVAVLILYNVVFDDYSFAPYSI
jgi:hypothetical protein